MSVWEIISSLGTTSNYCDYSIRDIKMKANLNVAGMSIEPGRLAYSRVAVPNTFYPDGAVVDIPLILINGKYEGPTLYLDAATHGSEVAGTEVLHRITREVIDPEKLHGSVIAIPIVNIPAFRICSMSNPHDFGNTNRAYPGDPKGSMNSKIAYFVLEIAKKADYAITFHTLSHASVALPFSQVREVGDRRINKKMKLMAKTFGITCSREKWSGKPTCSSFSAIAPTLGLPTILVELQSQYVYSRSEVEVGIRGVLNVMKSLNMIKGRMERQHGVTIIRKEGLKWVSMGNYERGGFLRPIAELGQKVRRGEEIAIFVDAVGSKVLSIKSPANGYVMAYSAAFVKPVVKEGGWLAIVFAEK